MRPLPQFPEEVADLTLFTVQKRIFLICVSV